MRIYISALEKNNKTWFRSGIHTDSGAASAPKISCVRRPECFK